MLLNNLKKILTELMSMKTYSDILILIVFPILILSK